MQKSIFEYADYKTYLNSWIDSRPGGGRGERSKIAEAIRCHVAYVSRVLNGDAQLSLEQGHQLNQHLGHSSEESDFFLLLLLQDRAGTADLRQYYSAKIKVEVERRSVLKNRLEYRKSLSQEDQTLYFSAWYYSAVHLLLSIPTLQTREALSRYLRVSPKRISEVLKFLVNSGLAIEKNGKYQTGQTSIHLGNDSPMISKHHVNWRMQAIQALERETADELHYSSAVTVAREDIPEIRKVLVSAIEKIRAIVRESKEDSLFCYSLDLFEVGDPSNR